MERPQNCAGDSERVTDERQLVLEIDHVIMTVTVVARRFSWDSEPAVGGDNFPGKGFEEKRTSFRSTEFKSCFEVGDDTLIADDHTYCYEMSFREGITVTTRSVGGTKLCWFVRCAAVAMEHTLRERVTPSVA